MKTLIVNLGPLGDVCRTTVLLRVLEGEIDWLSERKCLDILKSERINKVILADSSEGLDYLKNAEYDLVISLNEEIKALEVVKKIRTKKLIGVYLNKEGKVDYTPESAYWFDMSLSSKLGKEKADELKYKNKKPLPEILIEMVGKKWGGQEYDLGLMPEKGVKKRIGLINTNTGIWPNKSWKGYTELKKKLEDERYNVVFLEIKPSVNEHIEEISKCEVIVCGDTFGMHVALALKRKVVALFNCTSANEIYDYGRMIKIESPLLKKYFYQKEFSEEAVSAVKLEEVFSAVQELLNTKKDKQ